MKAYLGDGAYVDFDGYALILTAENGITATDRVVLEPSVFKALLAYVESLQVPENCIECGAPFNNAEPPPGGRCPECAA